VPGPGADDCLHDLIAALGDPAHAQHAHAVTALVALGPRAIPALGAALHPDQPWLTAYRAADALAQIQDGRTSPLLIAALHHPNSNVRWNVVRALATSGDARACRSLRRLAQQDRSKTSWGEAVAGTAQWALQQLHPPARVRRIVRASSAVLIVGALVVTLLVARTHVPAMRQDVHWAVAVPRALPPTGTAGTAAPAAAVVRGAVPAPTRALPPAVPSPSAPPRTTTVRAAIANVRSGPGLDRPVIGQVHAGDALIVLEQRGDWFFVQLGAGGASDAPLPNAAGWVSRLVITAPPEGVGVAQP
jgi:hypothetical protein